MSLKKCIIFNPTYDYNYAFEKYKFFFKFDKRQFADNGYEVLEHEVKNENDIVEVLGNLDDNSIGFLWVRGHGTPSSVTLGKDYVIRSKDVAKTFKSLPAKLTQDAHILLDSCSTGKFDDKFGDNVQFAFVQLTVDMPNIKVIAPTEDITNNQKILFDQNTGELFYYQEGYKTKHNVSNILGNNTKGLLKNSPGATKYDFIESTKLDNQLNKVKEEDLADLNIICKFQEYHMRQGSFSATGLSALAKMAILKQDIVVFKTLAKYLTVEDFLINTKAEFLNRAPLFIDDESIATYALRSIYNYNTGPVYSKFFMFDLPQAMYDIMYGFGEDVGDYYSTVREKHRIHKNMHPEGGHILIIEKPDDIIEVPLIDPALENGTVYE